MEILCTLTRGYVKFFGDRNVFSQAEQEELLKKYNKEDQQTLLQNHFIKDL